MKKSDLQTGVVYAYKPGKYDTVKPVVLLSLDLFQTSSNRWGKDVVGSPRFVKSTASRPVKGYYDAPTAGYLAVSNQSIYWGNRKYDEALSPEGLTALTLDGVLAEFAHGVDTPKAYDAYPINNVAIIGLYDEVMGARDTEARAKVERIAASNAQAQALVDAATARYDAFAALGVALPAPALDYSGYGDDKHLITKNAESVRLDAATLDQILRLLEG